MGTSAAAATFPDAQPKNAETMMRLPVAIVLLAVGLAAAQAQTQEPSSLDPPGGQQPAAHSDKAPLRGANSFVESQAREAVLSKGYEDVSALVNDREGIWRGTARKGGQTVHVSVDYRGNVDVQ